ncbi:MAG: NADH-quinone oxidoreductase subunit N [Candidatus Njordarchaeota archaeon]
MSMQGIFQTYLDRPALMISITILIISTLVNLGLERAEKKAKRNFIAFIVALVGLIIAGIALIIFPAETLDVATQIYMYDYYAKFFAVFGVFVTVAIVVAVHYYSEDLPEVPVFYALITGTAIGLILLPSAVDLIGLFIAWELLSVPLYAMVAYSHKWSRSVEGAMKYYIMGTASSAFLGLGIGIISAIAGTTNIYALSSALAPLVYRPFEQLLLGLAVISLVVGFGVKITLVPLHQWAPDTYEGSMPPITAYLSGTIKAIRFSAPLKVVMLLVAVLRFDARLYFAILAVLTMTYANIVALKQKRVYRMLAYSSIAQMGYIVIGIVAATKDGIIAAVFYAFAFAIMEVVVFMVIAIAIKYLGIETLDDYNGLSQKYPLLSIIFTLSLLSLVGIPVTVGFVGKVYLFLAALSAGILWLALALAINSAISLGYYGAIIKNMFLYEPSEKIREVKIPMLYIVILSILTLVILIGGLWPDLIFRYASRASEVFF